MDSLDDLADQLYSKELWKKLLPIAYKFTRRKDIAEDIVADSISEIYMQTLKKEQHIRNLEHFAKIVTRRKGIKWLNSKQHRNENSSAASPPDKAIFIDPNRKIEVKEMFEALKEHLNEIDYTIFDMYYKGYHSKEIAEIVHIKDGAVRRSISDTLKWLRKHFRK